MIISCVVLNLQGLLYYLLRLERKRLERALGQNLRQRCILGQLLRQTDRHCLV